MVTVKDPLRVAINKLYPASIYASPALAPLMVGVGGNVGAAQKNLTGMYKYTLEQMAVSPFAVNSSEYMQRIRNEYGYSDTGTYDAMGTVGSVVGAGVGAFLGSGAWRGLHTDNFSLLKPNTWFTTFQNPFQNPIKDGVPVGSKRMQTSAAFRFDDYGVRQFIQKHSKAVADYNNAYKGYNKARADLTKFINKNDLVSLDSAYNNIVKLTEQGADDAVIKNAQATYDLLKSKVKNIKEYEVLKESTKKASTLYDTQSKALTKLTSETIQSEGDTLLAKGANKVAAKVASQSAAKVAGTALGAFGTVMDAASLGANIAGAVQAFQDGNTFDSIMYTVGGLGDTVSLVGDVVSLVAGWTGVGLIAGEALNWIGALVSIGAGALVGSKIGETVGHSLSPEGATAQALFTKNLYGSIADRPITSIATVVTTAFTPALLNKLPRTDIPGVSWVSDKLIHGPWGNYLRSSLTMGVTQLVNAGTTKLEDTWRPPENAEDVNFVTAFSLIGDLNDNLYGATARKATLLGLVKGDPKAQTEALARAWGYSNEDIYYNPTFDDVRQAAGIDLGNLGNSVVGIIGEVLIDPQNLSEIASSIYKDKVVAAGADQAYRTINQTKAQMIVDPTKVDSTTANIIFDTVQYKGKTYFTKNLYYNDKTKMYQSTKADGLEPVQVFKDSDNIYRTVEDPEKLISSIDVEKHYNEASYVQTQLGNMDSKTLYNTLQNYYRAYIYGGADAVRSLYIDMTTPTQKGSKARIIQTSGDLFASNLIKSIEHNFSGQGTKHFTYRIKQEVAEAIKTTPEKFKQLYDYYDVKDSADLILKLNAEYTFLKFNDDQLHRLYNLNEGLANQMQLIESVSQTVTTLASPLGTIFTPANIKRLIDMASSMRYGTNVEYSAKILMDLPSAINKNDKHIVTQKEVEQARTSLKQRTNKDVKVDTLTKSVLESDEFKDIKEISDRLATAEEDIQTRKSNLQSYRNGQSLRIYDKDSQSVYIEITDLEKTKQEIIDLQNKSNKTRADYKRLRLLYEGYVHAFNQSWLLDSQIAIQTETAMLLSLLDPLTTQVTQYAMVLINEYNKFSRLMASTELTEEQYHEKLNTLERFFALADCKITKDSSKVYRNNVQMTVQMTLPEYIASVFNRYLYDEFKENSYDFKFTDIFRITEILNGIDIEQWKKMSKEAKLAKLTEIIHAESNMDNITRHREYLYASNLLKDKILGVIDKTVDSATGKTIDVVKPLNSVDIDFLKRKIITSLMKLPEFAEVFKQVQEQIKTIQDMINAQVENKDVLAKKLKAYKGQKGLNSLEQINETASFIIKILQDTSKTYLNRTITHHPIFSLIKEYIYTDIRQEHSFIESVYFSETYKHLDEKTKAKIMKGNMSDEDIVKLQLELAEKNKTLMASKLAYKVSPKKPVEEETTPVVQDIEEGTQTKEQEDEETNSNIVIDPKLDKQTIVDNTEKNINKEYNLDNLESDTKAKASFEFRTKDISKNVCDICTNVKDTINETDGYVEINVKASSFVDDTGKVWEYNQMFDDEVIDGKTVKGVYKSKYYQEHVEEFVDELIDLARKGVITIVGSKGTLYTGKKALNVRDSLINTYMTTRKGIRVRYNNVKKGKSSTGYYYRRLLKRELNNTIYVNLKDAGDTRNNYIKVNDEQLLIPKQYNTATKVYEYLKTIINDETHPQYELCKQFLESAYERANKYIDDQLAHDRHLGINKELLSLVDDLHQFEIDSIQSRYTSTPVVATDYVKRYVSNSQELYELLQDVADIARGQFKNLRTPLGVMIAEYNDYIESAGKRKQLNTDMFTNVIKQDDEFYFVTDKGLKLSLTSIMLDYDISRDQLDLLLRKTLRESSLEANTHYRVEINNRYTAFSNLYDKPTKEDFVDMNLAGDSTFTRKELEEAYDVLYSDPTAYELMMKLTYSTRASKKEDVDTVYNPIILKLYTECFKDVELQQTRYEREKMFLTYILKWKPSNKQENKIKQFLLKDVFFEDFKISKGVFNEEHIKNLKKAKESVQAKYEDEPENSYLEYIIKDLDSRIAYSEVGAKRFSDKTTKDAWINFLLNADANNKDILDDILKVFTNVRGTSDTKKYSVVKVYKDKGYQYVIAYGDSADFYKLKGPGAGKSNLYIVSNFESQLKRGVRKDTIYRNGNRLLYVTDDENFNYAKFKKEHADSKYVYVISTEQAKELRKMAKDPSKFTTVTERVKDTDGDDWELHVAEPKINVKSAKVIVPSYLEDLDNITKTYTDYTDFIKYINTYDKYVMLQKSYISRPSLLSSTRFKSIGNDAEVSVIFFDIIKKLGNKVSLNILSDYINDETIKQGKEINENTKTWLELLDIEIDGKTAGDIIKDEVNRLRELHKTTPIKVSLDFNSVLSTRMMNTLMTLKSIINRAVKQEQQGIRDMKLLRAMYKNVHDENMDLINRTQIEAQQLYNEDILKICVVEKSDGNIDVPATLKKLKEYYNQNRATLDEEYITRNNKFFLERDNKRKRRINFKTMHEVIRQLNSLDNNGDTYGLADDKTLFTIENDNIVWSSSLLNTLLNNQYTLSLITKMQQEGLSTREINKIIYNDILYPFIQNISLDFYKKPMSALDEAESILMGLFGDPRYAAASVYQHIINEKELPTDHILEYSELKDYVNDNLKEYIPKEASTTFDKTRKTYTDVVTHKTSLIKECNEKLIKLFVKQIINTKKYKDDFHPDLFDDYSKQRTEIIPTDYNKYTYDDSVRLRRSDYIVFKEGSTREEQTNVTSIGDSVEKETGITDASIIVDEMLHIVAGKLSNKLEVNKTAENNTVDKIELELDAHHIKTTKALKKFIIDTIMNKWFEGKNDAYRDMVSKAITLYRCLYYNNTDKIPQTDKAFEDAATALGIKDTNEVFNKIMPIIAKYQEHHLYLRRNETKAKTEYKSDAHFVRSIDTDLFVRSTSFYNWLRASGFKVGSKFKTEFENSKTLLEFYQNIYTYISDSNKQDVYAMLVYINHLKKVYTNQKSQGTDEDVWTRAYNLQQREYAKKITQFNDIDNYYGVGRESTSNIFQDLERPFEDYKKYTHKVKNLNDKLSRTISPKGASVKSAKIMDVFRQEKGLTVVLKQINRYTTAPLFKVNKEHNVNADVSNALNIALNTEHLELIQEMQAEKLEDCFSTSSLYASIRKLFTELLIISNLKASDKDFVRIMDITNALRSIEENTDMGAFYISQWDLYTNNKSIDQSTIKKAYNDILEFFSKRSYLTGMNEQRIKAIMGYIYYNKYNTTPFTEKSKDIRNALNKILTNKFTVEYNMSQSITRKAYAICTDPTIKTSQERADKIYYLWYPEVEEGTSNIRDTTEWSHIHELVLASISVNMDIQDSDRAVDTYRNLQPEVNNLTLEEFVQQDAYVQIKQDLVNKLEKRKEAIKRRKAEIKHEKHIVHTIVDDEFISTEINPDIDLSELDTHQTEIQNQIKKLNLQIDERKDKVEDKLKNLQIMFLDTELGKQMSSRYNNYRESYFKKGIDSSVTNIKKNLKKLEKDFDKELLKEYCTTVYNEYLGNEVDKSVYDRKEHIQNNLKNKYGTEFKNIRTEISNIIRCEQSINKYKNVDIPELQAEYASKVFEYFKYKLYYAKKEEQKSYMTQLKSSLDSDVNNIPLNDRIYNRTQKFYDDSINNNTTHIINIYKKLQTRFNWLYIKDTKDINEIVQILQSTIDEYTIKNNDAYRNLNEYKNKIDSTFTKQIKVLNKNELAKIVDNFELNTKLSSHLQQDELFKYIYHNNLDIETFIKDTEKDSSEADVLRYRYTSYCIEVYSAILKESNKSFSSIKKCYDWVNTSTHRKNTLDTSIVDNTQYINYMLDNIEETLGYESFPPIILEYADEIVNYKYMFSTQNDPTYKSLVMTRTNYQTKYDDNQNVYNKIKYLQDNTKLEEVNAEIRKSKRKLNSAKKHATEIFDKKELITQNASNSKLYKRFTKAPIKGNVAEHAINRAVKDGILSEPDREKIQAAGGNILHNPTVDCTVTAYNILYEWGCINDDDSINIKKLKNKLNETTKEDRFVVFDMETVTDITDEPTPYQMTVLDIRIENGELKSELTTLYYNSYVFIGAEDALKKLKDLKDLSSLDVHLQNFVNQQKQIYLEDEPDLSDEEILKRIIDIVRNASGRKNDVRYLRPLVTLLTNRTCPIVAHNGARFDFIHYDTFVKNYVRRIIQNEFFSLHLKSPKEVKTALTLMKNVDSLDIAREEKDALKAELARLYNEYESGQYQNEQELERIRNALHRVVSATIKSVLKYATLNAAKELNISLNNKSFQRMYDKQNNTFEKVIDYCYEYIHSANPDKYLKELDAGSLDKQALKRLFESVNKTFNKEPSDKQSILKTVEENIVAQFNLPVEQYKEYDNQQRVESLTRQIEELVGISNHLSTLAKDGKFTEFEDVVKFIEDKMTDLDSLVKQYDNALATLEKAIQDCENNMKTYNKQLYDTMVEIKHIIGNNIAKAKSVLHRDWINTLNKLNAINIDTVSLRNTLKRTEEEMQDIINVIDALVKALTSSESIDDIKLNDIILDSQIRAIRDEKTRKEKEEELKTRWDTIETHLKELKDDPETIWENAWQTIKAIATDNVSILKEELKHNINIVLQNKNLPEKLRDTFDDYLGSTSENPEKDLLTEIKKLLKDPEINAYIKNDDNMHAVTNLLVKGSPLMRNIEIAALKSLDPDEATIKYITNVLEKEQARISTTLTYVNVMDIKENKIIFDKTDTYIQDILSGLKLSEEELNVTIATIIAKASNKTPGSSKYTTDPEKIELFEKNASAVLDKSDEFYKDHPESKRRYIDADEGNDIWQVIENPEVATRLESKKMIAISFNTNYYNQLQTLYIPKDDNGNITDQSKWYFKYKYCYHLADKAKGKAQIYETDPIPFNADKPIFGDSKSKGIAPYDPIDMAYVYDGKDYSKEAIERLKNFAKELKSSKDIAKHIKDNTVDIKSFDSKHFTKINLSEVVWARYLKQLQLMNLAQNMAGTSVDLVELYRVIYRQTLGNLNAIKPGQYLFQPPTEHAPEIITKMSKEGEDKLEIDLYNVSEATMGNSLHEKTLYSIKALFGANTSTVRTVLATKILHSKWTPIVLNNDLFERQDADVEKKSLESYIYNLDNEKDKQAFDVWSTNKAEQEYTESKSTANKDAYIAYRKKELEELEHARYNYLIGSKEYKVQSKVCTLRVAQYDTLYKYDKDILHPMGVNATVAFTKDVRAFEDEIVIDKKWALAIGIDEANKIWLKYGFKGSVKFEENVFETYGAHIVSKEASVNSRGSYGLYLEMFGNNIVDYKTLKDPSKHLSEKTIEIFDQCNAIKDIKVYNTIDEVKQLKASGEKLPYVYIVGSTLVMEDSEKIDYEKFMNAVINNCATFEDGTNYIKNNEQLTQSYKYDYRDTLAAKAEGEYTYTDPKTNKVIKVKYDDTNNEIKRGTLFILMDAEHQASHLQSELALQLENEEGLTYVLKDNRGSVRKGGQKSFTVEQSFAQKIGYDLDPYIVGAEYDEDIKRQYDTSWQIFLNGMSTFDELYNSLEGPIDVRTDSIIKQHSLASSYRPLFIAYYKAKETNNKKAEEYTETKIKNHTLKLYGGDRGIGYTQNYRRYNAARAQLTANAHLEKSIIKMPADSWENLRKAGRGWTKSESISIKKINELFRIHAEKTGSKLIQFNLDGTLQDPSQTLDAYKLLRYHGIFTGYEAKDIVTRTIQGTQITAYVGDLKLTKGKLKQTHAYVLAVRYPVQDINATPIVKVTGVTEHSAVECNTAMYKYMGADNDGDAASFTMIKHTAVEGKDAPLKFLDASTEEYYDAGDLKKLSEEFIEDAYKTLPEYLLKQIEEYIKDDSLIEQIKTYINSDSLKLIKENVPETLYKDIIKAITSKNNQRVGTNVAYIGKKTAPVSAFTIDSKGNVQELPKKKSVRGGDNHYTYTELIYKDAKLYEELVKASKDFTDVDNTHFYGAEANDMFWLNSCIWLHNDGRNIPNGYDNKFYENKDAIAQYYDSTIKIGKNEIAVKAVINDLKRMEYWLNFTIAGQKFIQDNLETIIRLADYTTLERGRVSKINVGVTGGYRKGIYLGTTLSIFPHLNQDKTSKIWHEAYGVPLTDDQKSVKDFTVLSIFNTIFKEDVFKKMTIENIQNIIDDYNERKKYFKDAYKIPKYEKQYDIKEVSQIALEHYLEIRIAEKVVDPLINFLTTKHPTYDLVKALYVDEKGKPIDLLLKPMTIVAEYIKKLEDPSKVEVPEATIALIQSYYLSRFIPEFNEIKKLNNKDIKQKYIDGLKDEFFLTRSLSKVLNDLIQEPISISKHGSAIADYTEVDATMHNNVENVSDYLVKNHIFVGKSYKHSRAIAMGAEYNIHERKSINYKNSEQLNNELSERSKDAIYQYRISESNPSTSLSTAIDAIFKYDMCQIFTEDTTEFKKHYQQFTTVLKKYLTADCIVDLESITKEDAKILIDAITLFESHGTKLYQLINSSDVILNKINTAQQYSNNVQIPVTVQNLVSVLLLRGLDKEYYEDKINEYPTLQRFINYLIDKDNPIDGTMNAAYIENKESIEDLFYADENGKEIYGADDDLLKFKLMTHKQIASKVHLDSDKFITGYDLIIDKLSELKRLSNFRQDVMNTLNAPRTDKTLNEIREEIINRKIGHKVIKKTSNKASKVYANLNEAKTQYDTLQNEKSEVVQLKELTQQEYNKFESIQQGMVNPSKVIEDVESYKQELQQELQEVKKQHIRYDMLSHLSEISEILLGQGDDDINIKVLDSDDVDAFKDNILMNTDMYQHPFHILVNTFSDGGKSEPDWNAMYDYLERNYSMIRITEVVKAYDDEGLARKLINFIKVIDNNLYTNSKGKQVHWNELTRKERRKQVNKVKHKNITKALTTWEDLDKLTKDALNNVSFRLGNKLYDKIDKDLKNVEFVTPTLKQIKVRSGKDLKKLWYDGVLKNNLTIGFTYINDIMSAMEFAYKPYVMNGKGAHIARAFNSMQKAIMRFSSGFLLRNAMDTFNQLWSDMYLEKGLKFTLAHPRQIVKYLKYGANIYSMYEYISEERLFTLSDIRITYKNIEQTKDNKEIITLGNRLKNYLDSYIKQGDALDSKSDRIKHNLERAKQLLEQYEQDKTNKITYKRITEFLGSITFAEYYEFYDNKVIDGKVVYGLRIDAKTEPRKNYKRIKKLQSKHEQDLFKPLLIEISAFMQTNAQVDMFKQKQYKDLYDLVNQTQMSMLNATPERTIEQIDSELEILRAGSTNKLKIFMSNHTQDGYQWLTEHTENLARILGFILNKDLYGNTFDKSVQLSLKSWFNYGQRSPLEMQLMYDIPYISFPLRSINNWRSRLLNPKYMILMDDLIDGIYSQYSDEDGQYSQFEQFMIQNGWLPITNKLGIRAGSGAFDIYNLVRDPAGQIEQRRSPILRGLSKLMETHDVTQAANQLATVGMLNRAAQAATLGAYNKNTQSIEQPSLGRTVSMLFEYNQYTPKKYGYLYQNNGRAKYYENIYRDWFNKYGRMRKPTVDPVQLVKGIQWKQFVRRMQHKYRR